MRMFHRTANNALYIVNLAIMEYLVLVALKIQIEKDSYAIAQMDFTIMEK